jgi:hypothetical protein
MKSICDALANMPAVLMAGLLVVSCHVEPSHGSGDSVASGPDFDRIVIADSSGDVKLVGDIDGDGVQDLVAGGYPENPLSWWRWPDLRQTVVATATVEFTTDAGLADIDSDGDLDIVTADGQQGLNLIWFENPRLGADPSDSSRWARRELTAAGGWVKDIELADFDGDGRMDVAARTHSALMILFQDSGKRWTRADFSDFELGEEGMGSGDIDGDGDTDLVLFGAYAANPGAAAARDPEKWSAHNVGSFNPAFKSIVVDLDRDGRADIVTSSSEHVADVAWYRADNGPAGQWTRRIIQPSVQGAHTLQAADMDGDGDIDVVVGQMHTTSERELSIHYNGDGQGTRWTHQVIDNTGLHNGVVADIDGDGDFDIYGSNWVGNPPIRAWLNRLDPPAATNRIDRWTYHRIASSHHRSFGVAFADMNGDGLTDIISGRFWYRQPADHWDQEWQQTLLAEGLDAFAALDLDADGRAEIIAQRGGGEPLRLVWLKAADDEARSFKERAVGEVPAASHALGAQGHLLADLVPGGRPELVVSSGGGVFYFHIPETPEAGPWQYTRVCSEASDEGIAAADIDGDGLLDLVATTGEAREVAWWRNPGDSASDWARGEIGSVPEMVFPDRVAAADLDGDGHPDVVVTEENGQADGAAAYWWRNPGDGSQDWTRHEITARGSLNSLSAADMNGDGRPDLVMAEHRGALRMSIWNNTGSGRFVEQTVGEGMESHLGAQVVDLDTDGDLDIVSIAWDAPETIHVWRNEAVSKDEDRDQKPH